MVTSEEREGRKIKYNFKICVTFSLKSEEIWTKYLYMSVLRVNPEEFYILTSYYFMFKMFQNYFFLICIYDENYLYS